MNTSDIFATHDKSKQPLQTQVKVEYWCYSGSADSKKLVVLTTRSIKPGGSWTCYLLFISAFWTMFGEWGVCGTFKTEYCDLSYIILFIVIRKDRQVHFISLVSYGPIKQKFISFYLTLSNPSISLTISIYLSISIYIHLYVFLPIYLYMTVNIPLFRKSERVDIQIREFPII